MKLKEIEILYEALISGDRALESLITGLKNMAQNPKKNKKDEIDDYFEVITNVLNGIGQQSPQE